MNEHPPPKTNAERPEEGPASEKHFSDSDSTASASPAQHRSGQVIEFPSSLRLCVGCKAQLRGYATGHRYCWKCWNGAAAYDHLRQARRLLATGGT
jgi:hypothetical protein